VVNLLPTPKASDGPHGGPNQRDGGGRYYLPGQVVRLDERWIATDGTDYGPAIRRWEAVTGRPAPCPTEPGTRGNRRLSPAFAEWMMGLPAGYVTALDLPRNEQLKILGNGAVPQQAHHAYGLLLGARTAPLITVGRAA
jgi:DNA (cytosine-5)-methyltransferase 1